MSVDRNELHDRIGEAVLIARHWLCKTPLRKRRTMTAASIVGGGVEDVVHEVICNLFLRLNRLDIDAGFSTAICNQCQWTTARLCDVAINRTVSLVVLNGHDIAAVCPEPIDPFLKGSVASILRTLPYRERSIVEIRYGFGDGYCYTLNQAGRIFKLSRDRIRQIEMKAIRKLQRPVRADRLRGFADLTERT